MVPVVLFSILLWWCLILILCLVSLAELLTLTSYDGQHKKEVGDCRRRCMWEDLSSDCVLEGPVSRSLRPYRVWELCCWYWSRWQMCRTGSVGYCRLASVCCLHYVSILCMCVCIKLIGMILIKASFYITLSPKTWRGCCVACMCIGSWRLWAHCILSTLLLINVSFTIIHESIWESQVPASYLEGAWVCPLA